MCPHPRQRINKMSDPDYGTPSLDRLTKALFRLPGIGKKSAQRIAYYLLQRDRDGGNELSQALSEAMQNIGHCQQCRTFCEQPLCSLCSNEKRDKGLLCILENPVDVPTMENVGYRGRYFVLLGCLSPLDGVGPADLGLEDLKNLVTRSEIQEVILATNPTVEGNVTAQYIYEMLSPLSIRISRLAQGLPVGGELEYMDSSTLSMALDGRQPLSS